jgi:ABC-type uncharacterized transport system permease subunit
LPFWGGCTRSASFWQALVLAVSYVGGEMAQSSLRPAGNAATGVFQAMMLFFLLATDVLVPATGSSIGNRPRTGDAA